LIIGFSNLCYYYYYYYYYRHHHHHYHHHHLKAKIKEIETNFEEKDLHRDVKDFKLDYSLEII